VARERMALFLPDAHKPDAARHFQGLVPTESGKWVYEFHFFH
jgi:hypothetical protein